MTPTRQQEESTSKELTKWMMCNSGNIGLTECTASIRTSGDSIDSITRSIKDSVFCFEIATRTLLVRSLRSSALGFPTEPETGTASQLQRRRQVVRFSYLLSAIAP